MSQTNGASHSSYLINNQILTRFANVIAVELLLAYSRGMCCTLMATRREQRINYAGFAANQCICIKRKSRHNDHTHALNPVSQCNHRSDAIIARPIIVITVAISVATFAKCGKCARAESGKMNLLRGSYG